MTTHDISKTAAFTGHRPKYFFARPYDEENRPKYNQIVGQIKDEILNLYDNYGVRTFISGGAQGFDQLAFWAVHAVKQTHPDIRNLVYIPLLRRL